MGKNEIRREISRANSIILVGHINPDGDSIGCQLALAAGLEQLGKDVSVQGFDAIPRFYRRLPGADTIQINRTVEGFFDLAIMIECPILSRSGYESIPANRMAGIDHHPDYNLKADVNWLDVKAAATAELIYELLIELGCEITKEIAENLLTGIITDSGSFTYPNTRPGTLEVSAKLMRTGVRPIDIYEKVYRSYPAERLDLLTDLLCSMQRLCDGQLAVMTIDYDTVTNKGYSDDLYEDVVNIPLTTEIVLVSALGRQDSSGIWRFSLRSKHDVDAGAIAKRFGGGGHRNAAGFRSNTALEEIISILAEEVETKYSLSGINEDQF